MLNSVCEGRRLFVALNCYDCHGPFAAGAIGPDIAGASRSDVQDNVLHGNASGMPSFAAYVDENDITNITNITNYLDSVGTSQSPVFFDWWKPIPRK